MLRDRAGWFALGFGVAAVALFSVAGVLYDSGPALSRGFAIGGFGAMMLSVAFIVVITESE